MIKWAILFLMVFTSPARAEYIMVDTETIADNPALITNTLELAASTGDIMIWPTITKTVIKHFDTLDQVVKYLNEHHTSLNFTPEVYEVKRKVDFKCDIKESKRTVSYETIDLKYSWKPEGE